VKSDTAKPSAISHLDRTDHYQVYELIQLQQRVFAKPSAISFPTE